MVTLCFRADDTCILQSYQEEHFPDGMDGGVRGLLGANHVPSLALLPRKHLYLPVLHQLRDLFCGKWNCRL